MTDQPVSTPVSWIEWAKRFIPAPPSRPMQVALVAAAVLNLWVFDIWIFNKLPSLPSVYPEPAPPMASAPAPVAYVTASEVASLMVDLGIMKAKLGELETRLAEHEKPKAQITTGSISKPKKQ